MEWLVISGRIQAVVIAMTLNSRGSGSFCNGKMTLLSAELGLLKELTGV